MKRYYIKPAMQVLEIGKNKILCASGQVVSA